MGKDFRILQKASFESPEEILYAGRLGKAEEGRRPLGENFFYPGT